MKKPWWQHEAAIAWALILFFPLGIFMMWRYAPWRNRFKWLWTTAGAIVVLLVVAGAVGGSEAGDSVAQTDADETVAAPTMTAQELAYVGAIATQEAERAQAATAEAVRQEASPSPTVEPPVTYEIADRADVSFGATIRIVYRVSVSGPLAEDDLRRIAQEIIEDETSQQDVDAIGFFFYLPGTDTASVYSAGKADWAPNGDWASADTVRAGDYSSHELGAIDVGGAYGELGESEETTGLSEDERRTMFKELVAAEDRADAEAYATYPDAVEEQIDLYWELLEEYKAEVRAKYGITEEQSYEIVAEGVTEYWPRE